MPIKNDIEKANNIIIEDKVLVGFNNHTSLYPFTTENIKEYYEKLDFKDKSILTTTASGDHIINSIYYKSKRVDSFDINKFSKYFSELKLAAIKNLSYEEFLSYFVFDYKDNYSNKKIFNKKKYEKIREELNDKSKKFWDELYKQNKPYKIRESKIFRKTDVTINQMKEMIPYITKQNYKKTQENYKNVKRKTYDIDLMDIPETIKTKYDLIILSNILSYLDKRYEKETLVKFKYFLENELSQSLKENGSIIFAYIYKYLDCEDRDYAQINNCGLRNEVFKGKNYSSFEVTSALDKDSKDLVMVYKQKK